MEMKINSDLVMMDGAAISQGMSAMNHLTFAGWPHLQFCAYRYSVELCICCESIEEISAVKELCNKYLNSEWTCEEMEFENLDEPYWWIKYKYSKKSA